MKQSFNNKGFTVLEFLIVIGIMIILIGLILVGLDRARTHARDEGRISSLNTIALALQQYHDVCREYPNELTVAATCDTLAPANLGSFISDIETYRVNQSDSRFGYIPLAYDGDSLDTCVGYHLYVKLEQDEAAAAQGAKFDATSSHTCPHTTGDQINAAADPLIFDIVKDVRN